MTWEELPTSGLSPYSAYLGLTQDWTAVTYSSTFQGLDVTAAICATFAFFFTAICLYIQASGLLTGLRIKHPSVYVAIASYLAFTSTFALVFRITLTAYQSLYLTHKIEWNPVLFVKLQLTTGIAYAVCLGSYCTISLASVCWLIYSRSHLIISNRPYDAALTILSLIFMESFIVPSKFESLDVKHLTQSSYLSRPSSFPRSQVSPRRTRRPSFSPCSPPNGVPLHDSS